MKQKVAAIVAHGESAAKQERRTTVTENEVNSYLAYEAADQLPTGVVQPSLTALGDGRISGRAIVDLDAVRKAGNSTSLFDPRSYLTGHVPVTATGVLHASNGRGRFQLESASVGALPIPKLLLQEIVGLLLEEPRQSGRHQPRRRVRTAGAHPRNSGRARSGDHRAMSHDHRGSTRGQPVWGTASMT